MEQNYTAQDFEVLFEDANLTVAQQIHSELIGNLSAKTAVPGTHFYGFYGSGASFPPSVHQACKLIAREMMLGKEVQVDEPGFQHKKASQE